MSPLFEDRHRVRQRLVAELAVEPVLPRRRVQHALAVSFREAAQLLSAISGSDPAEASLTAFSTSSR